MASNWGRNSRGLAVEGRSISGDDNPRNLPQPARNCGADWVLNLALPVDGMNNDYGLDCPATGGAQANSDIITIRRGSALPVDAATRGDGRLMIQSTRVQGEIFEGQSIPDNFSAADSSTHGLVVSSYYVSSSSNLIKGVPTLRRHRLTGGAAGPRIVDEEVYPGVENLQIQLGIDVNQDNSVDRYVNPGDAIYDPGAVGYVPGARVITARIWLIVRGLNIEPGIQNDRNFDPADVKISVPNDSFRRMQISKTILLRNART
jgi:type IV pilus assembly protein PilW